MGRQDSPNGAPTLLAGLATVIAGVRGSAFVLLDAHGQVVVRSLAAQALAPSSGRPPDDRMASEGESEWQGWLERPGGGRFWAEVRTTPLPDPEGRLLGYLQVVRDETRSAEAAAEEQRKAASLLQGERLLSRARRMARRGGWEWNPHTRELQMTDEVRGILGLPADGKVSLDAWYDLVHPEDRGPLRETIEATLRTGGAFRILVRIRRPDGVDRVLLCDGDTESETDDELGSGLFGTVVDVTGQQSAREALAKSERDFQAVHAQSEAILYADSEMRLVEANPAAERMFGYPLEELVGRQASALLGPQACASGPAPTELQFRGRDGRIFSGESLRIPVDDASGRTQGTLWMISDVSARRRAEERLVEARRRMAASREAERGRLARELHDGPVQDLIALSYQLAHVARTSPAEATEAGRMRGRILEVVNRLRSLIGDLRPPGLAELGLEAALEGLVLRLGDELPRVELDLRDGAKLPEATAVCLYRAVQEALLNVAKHAGARQVGVRLRTVGEQVRLTVWDDGCGFRVPDNLQDLSQDLHFGLVGLAERAELARGEFAVQSEPGRGTMVQLTLPLGEDPDA